MDQHPGENARGEEKSAVKDRFLQLHVFPLEKSEKNDEDGHDQEDGDSSAKILFFGAFLDPVPQGNGKSNEAKDAVKPLPNGRA
jgi:hypothetical protein